MDNTTNALNWFEIPVTNMARAKHFYQIAFGIHMDENGRNGNGFRLSRRTRKWKSCRRSCKSENHKPSTNGITIYLNANPDMSDVLKRIEGEGGQIIMGKTQITPEIGYMAFFIDSEGNRIGLHSQN